MIIKNIILCLFAVVIMAGCDTMATKNNSPAPVVAKDTTPKITGIGGIFFKSGNPASTKDWYTKNLGLVMEPYGAVFEFKNANSPNEANYLSWAVFKQTTSYFKPSEKEFMINYRVQNMDGLLRKLRNSGVTIVDTVEKVDYGKFVHIMDPDGNKIELWEPIDSVLTKIGAKTNK